MVDDARGNGGAADAALSGARSAARWLAPAIFLAMVGYGAYAHAMGLDLALSVAACLLLWGIPQQLTYTDLAQTGTTLPLMALSVALVSGRSLFLNVACAPLVRDPARPYPKRLWLFAQFISPSNWAHMRLVRDRLRPDLVPAYFTGVIAAMIVFSVAGVVTGHTLGGRMPPALLAGMSLLPALYVLLLVLAVPQPGTVVATLAGAVTVPLCSAWTGELGLALGGLVAGTFAFAIAPKRRRGHR